MAKRQKPGQAVMKAAEVTGRALGRVAGRVGTLKRRPTKRTRAEQKLIALAEKAGARSGAVVKNATSVAGKAQTAATRARKAVTRGGRT